MNKVGVGIIGLGFMGRTHFAAWCAARTAGYPCQVVAVNDARVTPERLRERIGNMATSDADIHADLEQVAFQPHTDALLAHPDVALVSICTPTDTHVPLTLAALEANKHVLVEKPLALTAEDCERAVAAAARKPALWCMPALCMRFWPAWAWVRERIVARDLGKVRSAAFERLGSRPTWSPFYSDDARCGGALIDLHIHDTDFVRWCFGDPDEVRTFGSTEHFTTAYRFPDGPPHVTAEGAWDQSPGCPFTMRYRVVFEEATADFDLSRPATRQLLLARGDTFDPVPLEPHSGYDVQARQLLDAVLGKRDSVDATLSDAAAVARLLERERISLREGRSA